MTEPFERELAVFSAARRLPASERATYLDQTCAGNAALRRRVEELLRAGEEAAGFLQEPAPGAQRPEGASTSSTLALNAASGEKAGDRIGHYKLLQQIGEGGCGLVYMAEQEEPVRRRVALKIIKLGMDTKSVIARFEAERQALALMDHPNIARVLDAGATDTGRPYFVMELVRGIKITEYCDEHNLSTKERLDLFIQVCHAVQHAHQKGIIHRDLKPSNILVTLHDGPASAGVPKVIDFGIAKATQGRLTDQTLFTAFEQFIGTPAYMSPEQAEMSELGIDTRSDIYGLGVLLYELLTGRTPFDATELLRWGVDTMRRTIREQEPERPSTRLSTLMEGELSAIAKHRHTEAVRLIHLLRGDLDWIVMKCLEKDRARRYETASGLANDVKRHLNCEPVVARPPSKLYEFQKTVRRHKFGFAAAGAVGAALFVGLVVSTWLLMKEKADRQRVDWAERAATEELWHSYLAQARAARFSGQPGRRFDSLAALRKAAAIRFSPELRDEAIACLALPDLKASRRIASNLGVFDCALERYACVLTNSGQISIRSASDDHELLRLPLPSGAGNIVALGKFSHNGNFLPVWHSDHLLRVWDLERREAVLTVPVATSHDSVDFQPDDQCLAVASRGETSIYELATGQKINSFPVPFTPSVVRFDPSGHKLAISSYADRRLRILDAATGSLILALTNTDRLGEVAWHPHSPILAAAGQETPMIYLWDTSTGRQLLELKGHQNIPFNVAFSHDGEFLVSSGWDGTHLWHVRTREHLMSYRSPGGHESFAPGDGAYGHSPYGGASLELFAFSSGREARRWHTIEEDRNHKSIAFSSDGRWLAFGHSKAVDLFDARTSELLATLPTGSSWGVCFQKNGSGLLVSSDRGLFRWPIGLSGGADEISIGPPQAIGPLGGWEQVSLSENGQVFAAYHGDHVRLFDGETLKEVGRTGRCGYPGQYRYVSLSADGLKLATGGWHDTAVKIWDTPTGALVKELAEPEWGFDSSPWPMFERNGRSLLIVSLANCRVWDTNSWTPGPRLPGAELPMMVALSPRGALAAVADQTSIQLRDLATGEVLATLQSSIPNLVAEVAFSPDETQLAVTYGRCRELLVWDLRLLREQLKNMGLDWARPPYPPTTAESASKGVHFRVLTNSLPPDRP